MEMGNASANGLYTGRNNSRPAFTAFITSWMHGQSVGDQPTAVMREELKKRNRQRFTATATVARFGKRRGWKDNPITTVCLTDVRDVQGKLLADHIWMDCGRRFETLGLVGGERVVFRARVDSYAKGYLGDGWQGRDTLEVDYKLSYPTKVKRVKPLPLLPNL